MRLLIISDLHSNLVALEAVLKHADRFDRVWCLGDVVGYGPEPNGCIERLSALEPVCLAGNHDWAALGKLDLEDFNPEARQAAIWTRGQLTPSNRAWLDALPERISTQLEKFTLVHGSPRHPIWEYVLTAAIAQINFPLFDTPLCLIGHTHVPVLYRYHPDLQTATAETLPPGSPVVLGPERMMINPGSVGQPRDGDPRAAYAILDSDALTLTHHRIEYDIAATQAGMEQAQLPIRLIQRLSYGR